jgi:hypothetical protein
MTPRWLAKVFENDKVDCTKRERRCRKGRLKRSTALALRAAAVITRCPRLGAWEGCNSSDFG